MKKILFLLLVCSLNSFALGEEKSLVVCYDHWPPSTIFPQHEKKDRGFTIDMIEKIFKEKGYKVSYSQVPYARGISMTQDGNCDLIAEVPEGQEKGLLFPSQPTFSYKQAFFTSIDNKWKYKGIQSLKKVRVGNIVGYDYSQISPEYEKFLHDPRNNISDFSGESAILQNLQMINLKRIDTFNEAYLIASYVMKENHLDKAIHVAGFLPKPLVLKPAFSPKNPKAKMLMKIWDDGRKSLQEIDFLKKYGLKNVY